MADNTGLFGDGMMGGYGNNITAANIIRSRYRQPIAQAAMENADTGSIRNIPPTKFESWLNESGQRLMNPTDTIAQGVKDFTGQSDVDMGLGLMGGGVGATVWHGSPHTFGKFDASKIGTGEGAQAYGHGHYTGGARKVGETYKRAGSGLEVNYAKPLQELGINPNVASHSMAYDESPLNQALGRITKGLRTTALDYPDVPLDQKLVKAHFDEEIRMLNDKYPKEAAQKKALQDLVAKEGYPDINFGGYLYKIDLPDEHIAKMLDWDKPLSQQHPDVQAALQPMIDRASKSLPHIRDTPDMTGASIYQASQAHRGGNPEEVSAAMQQAGIPGIRYLDGGSRNTSAGELLGVTQDANGWQAKIRKTPSGQVGDTIPMANSFTTSKPYQTEQEARDWANSQIGGGTSNYVVFPGNEDMLTILERNNQPLVNALRSK